MEIQLPKTLPKVNFSSAKVMSNTSWMEVVLLVVVIALVSWFLVLPKQREVSGQKAQLTKLAEDKEKQDSQVDLLKKQISKLQASRKQLSTLDEALPLDGREVRLELLLQSIADSSGLTKTEIGVTGTSEEPEAGNKKLLENKFTVTRSLKKLTASVAVSGSFDNLVAFMRKVEHSGRLLYISNFEINPGQNQDLELKMSVDGYYFGL